MPVLKMTLSVVGDILFVWTVWAIFYFFACSVVNIKELNYERVAYVILTNLGSVAVCYLYVRFLKDK